MINYVIYGNTDYLDVLQIQTDYISGRGNLTLLLNENSLDLTNLYAKYDKVIFYNGNDPYATRLLTCIEKMDNDYFLFIHDIDILVNMDNEYIEKFYDFLRTYNFDRIDLKFTDTITDNSLIIKSDKHTDVNEWSAVFKNELQSGIYLVMQSDPKDYIYNVNPSIWNRMSLLKILSAFKSKNYRTIEEMDVQNFSKQFKVFKLYSDVKLDCGYFKCLDIFTYLHISHSGKLLPLNQTFTTVYGQPYNDVSHEYVKIVDKYDLKKSPKWIN